MSDAAEKSFAGVLGLGGGTGDTRPQARRSGGGDDDRKAAARAVKKAVDGGSEDDLADALDAYYDLRRAREED